MHKISSIYLKLQEKIRSSFLFQTTKNYKSGIGILEITGITLIFFLLSIFFPKLTYTFYYLSAFLMAMLTKYTIKKTLYYSVPIFCIIQAISYLFLKNRVMGKDLGFTLLLIYCVAYGLDFVSKIQKGKIVMIYFIAFVSSIMLAKGANTFVLIYLFTLMLCKNRIQAEILSIILSGKQAAFILLGSIFSHLYDDTKTLKIGERKKKNEI